MSCTHPKHTLILDSNCVEILAKQLKQAGYTVEIEGPCRLGYSLAIENKDLPTEIAAI